MKSNRKFTHCKW